MIVSQGSVEIAPKLGYADAISDLITTGNTLKANGLRVMVEIFSSEAILIGHIGISRYKKEKKNELLVRLRGIIEASKYKYLVMNAPISSLDSITRVAPGLKSPTISPLATEGWVSIHIVIKESDFWDTIRDLRKLGVVGIVELPIERVIF